MILGGPGLRLRRRIDAPFWWTLEPPGRTDDPFWRMVDLRRRIHARAEVHRCSGDDHRCASTGTLLDLAFAAVGRKGGALILRYA